MNETVDQVRFLCNQMRDVLDGYAQAKWKFQNLLTGWRRS
jgi:hypothetical protein